METFRTAYMALMDAVNRPESETVVLTRAKREINNAVRQLQRDHAYNYTERLTKFTYPAATLQLDLGAICGGSLRDLMSVQQVSADGITQGKPLKLMTYSQLQNMRRKYERTHTAGVTNEIFNETLSGWTIEDAYRCDKIAFLVGSNFGIYPTQQSACYYMLNCHIWMPVMSGDDDTNFLLEYGCDVVDMLALKRMHIYMRNDSQFQFSEQELTEAKATLLAWDGQVTRNSYTTQS